MLATGNTTLLSVAHAFQAEISLRQGQLATADQWADQFESIPPIMPMFRMYEPHFTLAKIWLARNTPASRRQTAVLLDQLRNYAETVHNNYCLIQVMALLAILHAKEDEEPAALARLEKTLELAQVGGFVRLFADLGPPMARLLNKLRDQGTLPDYVSKILMAFHEPALDRGQKATGVRPEPLVELVESLTPRELEVLELLAQRLTNREIAEDLVVSLGTVKTHTLSIYTKLDVHGRRQAVNRARELGLLSPT
jgi:LuxR family maltose regulon positive regulatory protein